MRVGRVGFLAAIAAALPLALAGAAPAATPAKAAASSFKVTISPEYTTAGEPTTFQVTVVNTSTAATTLGSVKVTPPAGFTPPRPVPGAPLRRKTRVQNRTLSLVRLKLRPGGAAQLSVSATAPSQCGATHLHWSSQAFNAATGRRLALGSALSSLGVTVLCPQTSPCGNPAQACTTSLATSNSTYSVVSDASSGALRQTVNVGNRLVCGGYRFRDPNWYDTLVIPTTAPPSTAAPAPIVDEVTYTIRNTTAKGTGFCLGAGYDFTTASGAQAPAGTLPNGNPGFIGLLPPCSNAKAPCISSITQPPDPKTNVGFDALMKIQIPETGDPWGAG